MFSTAAYAWAADRTDISAVLFFDYDQMTCDRQYDAVLRIHEHFRSTHNVTAGLYNIRIMLPINGSIEPITDLGSMAHRRGLPDSYIPARNLILLAYATQFVFEFEADMIIIGCHKMSGLRLDDSPQFASCTAAAVSLAVGHDTPVAISMFADALGHDVVNIGQRANVPWQLTFSCETSQFRPCFACDSCIERVQSFVRAGVRDPAIIDDVLWTQLKEEYTK